jgi:hypothetical protein|tara:strand:+ start:127 stop:345 length:219 start_codon:yes stop_codon:yes gene_type:complete
MFDWSHLFLSYFDFFDFSKFFSSKEAPELTLPSFSIFFLMKLFKVAPVSLPILIPILKRASPRELENKICSL